MPRRAVLAVLLVLVLAAGGLTVWLAVDEPGTSGPSSAVTGVGVVPTIKDGVYVVGSIPDPGSRAALQAAVDAVPAALSYDYRSLDKSLASATALMTDAFAAEYTDIFDRTTRKMAVDKEAVTTTLVRAAGVSTAIADDRVTCLVYLDQFLLASKGQKPSKSYTAARVHVTLEKVGGAWKVAVLEPF
jgi:hypothetical protein